MNKFRGEAKNWYSEPIRERQRMMREHGMIGRHYAGRVTQIISGSIGFDDWEWGVDLFADDPLVFKKLVYEMRFDEASAVYGLFGTFFVGLRFPVSQLARLVRRQDAELHLISNQPSRQFSRSALLRRGGTMRLKDKVTIITGAAHGIGKAYARRFAEEGAHVVIADIDGAGGAATANAILDAGGSAWSRTSDVRSLPNVQGLMQETVNKFGRIDVLLNNAAIYVTQKLWKGAGGRFGIGRMGPRHRSQFKRRISVQQSRDPDHEATKERQDYQHRVGDVF